MTTADIVFAQPGNPDRLRDHEQDARMIFWALLVAILIHLLVAFLLAAFSGFFSPALPAPEKPVELTFMDLSTGVEFRKIPRSSKRTNQKSAGAERQDI